VVSVVDLVLPEKDSRRVRGDDRSWPQVPDEAHEPAAQRQVVVEVSVASLQPVVRGHPQGLAGRGDLLASSLDEPAGLH